MRSTLRLRAALLGLALTGLTALAPGANQLPPPRANPAPAVSPTAQAATVNGEPILEMAVQRALERVPPARRAEERPRLINYLVDNLLIDQSLRAAGYKIDPGD